MPSAAPPGTNWPSVATAAAAAEATFDRAQCHARQSHRQTTSPRQSNATAPHRTAVGLLDRGFPTPFFYSVDRGRVCCTGNGSMGQTGCTGKGGLFVPLFHFRCDIHPIHTVRGGYRFLREGDFDFGAHIIYGASIVGVLTHFPDRVGRAYPYEVGVASRAGEQKSSLEHQGRCDDRLPPSSLPPLVGDCADGSDFDLQITPSLPSASLHSACLLSVCAPPPTTEKRC